MRRTYCNNPIADLYAVRISEFKRLRRGGVQANSSQILRRIIAQHAKHFSSGTILKYCLLERCATYHVVIRDDDSVRTSHESTASLGHLSRLIENLKKHHAGCLELEQFLVGQIFWSLGRRARRGLFRSCRAMRVGKSSGGFAGIPTRSRDSSRSGLEWNCSRADMQQHEDAADN